MATFTALLRKDRHPLRPDEPEKWDVLLDGELIVSRRRDPEHVACRALLARGLTGMVTFIHESGMTGLVMDIEKGAGLTTTESDNGVLRVQKWSPHPRAVSSPARVLASVGTRQP